MKVFREAVFDAFKKIAPPELSTHTLVNDGYFVICCDCVPEDENMYHRVA
jgi:hypothetical protein